MLKTRHLGEKIIVEFENEFTIREVKDIKDLMAEWEKTGESKVIFDMESVKFIDSSAIGILVMVLKFVKKANGYLKLYSIRPEVEKILKMVNLYSYFEVVQEM